MDINVNHIMPTRNNYDVKLGNWEVCVHKNLPHQEKTEAGTTENVRINSTKMSENLESEENGKFHETEIADTQRNENRKTTRKCFLKITDEVDLNVSHTFSGLCHRCCYWFGLAFLAFSTIHRNNCPAQPCIPIYMTTSGCLGIVGVLIGVTRQVMEKRGRKRIVIFLHKFVLVSSICIILPWYVVGCVWLYQTYEPQYEDKSSADYCHKSLYLFAFFFQSILFMFICLLILLEILYRFIEFYRLFKKR
ncbi:uncharacterized protein LOC111086629 isoform X2 [Limulus polyphemus]|uniref:Uncharacterized protein LOC111086629 isoform X2 n=1 Tax=Limulus polyphemus TaxID=6850 RepID=A0ABM1SQR5_LIMPO|nr:uncharacterized protein LOC111086629 isoform X2 [Limulus polyphemus]